MAAAGPLCVLAGSRLTITPMTPISLQQSGWPRVYCGLVVALSGAAAFLVSFGMLAFGVHSMALRYGVAALAGYGVFVALMAASVRRWRSNAKSYRDSGQLDIPDSLEPWSAGSRSDGATPRFFAGGRSGGGGSTGDWGASTATPVRARTGGFRSSFDLDEHFVWIIIAIVAAFAGLVAVGYVIYVAPALLAEAALDAAVAGGVYRGLRRRDGAEWTTHLVRRTAIPALAVVVSALVAGYALQRIAPDARSIGGVLQHLQAR